MNRALRYSLAVTIASTGLVLGLVYVFAREPKWEGRKLSEWVALYGGDTATALFQEQADGAIRRIGPEAIPFLLKWIRYEAPPRAAEGKFYQIINQIIGKVNSDWCISENTQISFRLMQANASVEAFRALGQAAEPAIPSLCKIFNDPNASSSAVRAGKALALLGEIGFRPLLGVLTNQHSNASTRYTVAGSLRLEAKFARHDTVPLLELLLRDPDPVMRMIASDALKQFHPEVVPRP